MAGAPWPWPRSSRSRRSRSARWRGCAGAPGAAHSYGGVAVPPFYAASVVPLLLVVIRRVRGRARRWRSPIGDPHTIRRLLVPHPEVQAFSLQEIGDLLQALLAEILDLQN